MSRNRCETACACGVMNLRDLPQATLDARSPSAGELYTAERLRPGSYLPWGYSFRDDLNGAVSPMWAYYTKDGKFAGGSNSDRYSRDAEERGHTVVYEPSHYDDVPVHLRYRWGRIQCPLCLREYIGWYVRQPYLVSGPMAEQRLDDDPGHPVYQLYDTSFFYSFNDEPIERDLEGVRSVDQGEMIRLYVEALDARS